MSSSTFVAGDDERCRVVGDRCIRSQGTCTFDLQTTLVLQLEAATSEPSRKCRLAFDMNAGRNHFNLFVDGRLYTSFRTPQLIARRTSYAFEISDPSSRTVVSLAKRTEANATQVLPYSSSAAVVLYGVTIGPEWRLLQPALPGRRVEILGDSDSAGFGNEGPPSLISLRGFLGIAKAYQNSSNAWPQCLCRMLGAEGCVVAWSGLGVIVNARMMPSAPGAAEYYLRALASRAGSRHDFEGSNWIPHLVVISLGANDLFGGREPPTLEQFVTGYVNLLRLVRARRPAPIPILVVVASLETPSYRAEEEARGEPQQLYRYTAAAFEEYRRETADAHVHLLVPQADMLWPEDGGSVEHWGVSGMLKFATALCAMIEQLPSGDAGAAAGWRRVTDGATRC